MAVTSVETKGVKISDTVQQYFQPTYSIVSNTRVIDCSAGAASTRSETISVASDPIGAVTDQYTGLTSVS